jgi:hypothetical protein
MIDGQPARGITWCVDVDAGWEIDDRECGERVAGVAGWNLRQQE